MIYFVHIPKTAGTTLIEVMQRQYDGAVIQGGVERDDRLFPTREALETMDSYLKSADVFVLHMPFGIADYLDRDYRYMTFLREPIARVVSHYNFSVRAGNHWGQFILEHGFERIFEDDGNVWWRNMQTRYLAGPDSMNKTKLDDSDLALAKEHLEKDIDLLGIVERFDESLLYFKAVLGWNAPVYSWLNRSSRYNHPGLISKSSLTDSQRALLEEHHQYDKALYEFGVELFNQRLARVDSDFSGRIRQFHLQNRLYYLSQLARNALRKLIPR